MSKSKVNVSPQEISARWNAAMKNAVSKIQQGVNGVTENPCEKAAANVQKMKAGIIAAIDSGRVERGLRKVTLADWKDKTASKVATNLSTGVDAAMAKRQSFDTWLVSKLNSILPQIANMPNATFSDKVQKMVAYATQMHQEPYK